MALQRGPGQLDEISEAIGRLSGQVESLDRYTHEREHGLNNLAQKIDALRVSIAKDIATVEAKMDARLSILEKKQNTWTGARMLAAWFVQTMLTTIAAVTAVLSFGHGR